jgi:NADPH:quinone reductase-like Zn-dependent oxidoreductase
MKALQMTAYGGNEVAVVSTNAPQPEVKNGTVLVHVHTAALNPVDWKIREGYMKDMVPREFPATLGCDFSGVIDAISDDVTDFAIGDEVFGSAIVSVGGSGAFAEYLVTPAVNIARKPARISHDIAAAAPTVGVCGFSLDEGVEALDYQENGSPGGKIVLVVKGR